MGGGGYGGVFVFVVKLCCLVLYGMGWCCIGL